MQKNFTGHLCSGQLFCILSLYSFEMAYVYPGFVRNISALGAEGKRYSLEAELDLSVSGTCLVIQKNPSKANQGYSDHTINRVLNYIDRNRKQYSVLHQVGKIVFLNLIPWYETYSDKLVLKKEVLIDPENTEFITRYLTSRNPCIIAWGNSPTGLRQIHDRLADGVLGLLRKYNVPTYRVGPLTQLGHPRHGQIWGYTDPLMPL